MRRISRLSRQILAQNSGRDFDRLTMKLARLRADPFAFFRGANPLFLSLLPPTHFLFQAPNAFVCGDLHLENFGAYKGDNRLCYFDINDFDEACLAPFTIDLVRFVTGVNVAAQCLSLRPSQCRLMIRRFLSEYAQSISNGKPRWIERSLAQGIFRELLRRAMRRTRTELLNRYTKLKDGERRFRVGKRALELEAADRSRLQRFLARLRVPAPRARFFDLLDAAHRVAGNGSLGLERYIVLVRGRGSPNQNFVLDLKFAARSAVIDWLKRPQPPWPNDAARVVGVQRILQAIAPAMLHAVQYRGRAFVLKELQPSVDRLDLGQWRERPRRFKQAIEGMARVAAWAHLRSCGHRGAAPVEVLQAYVAGKRWTPAVERLSKSAAGRMHQAWRTYCKDYDAGAVTAAIKPPAPGGPHPGDPVT
jgi:uncharacterized protein (DUF2252 family)